MLGAREGITQEQGAGKRGLFQRQAHLVLPKALKASRGRDWACVCISYPGSAPHSSR